MSESQKIFKVLWQSMKAEKFSKKKKILKYTWYNIVAMAVKSYLSQNKEKITKNTQW